MLRLAAAIALLMVSVFMFIGFLAGGGRQHELGINIMVFGVAVVIPGAGGLSLLRQHLRRLPEEPTAAPLPAPPSAASRVVHLAEEKGGRLTVVEVVGELGLGADDAEAIFAALVAGGMADVEMTDSGLTVYVFRDIERLKDKGTSHGVLDEG